MIALNQSAIPIKTTINPLKMPNQKRRLIELRHLK